MTFDQIMNLEVSCELKNRLKFLIISGNKLLATFRDQHSKLMPNEQCYFDTIIKILKRTP